LFPVLGGQLGFDEFLARCPTAVTHCRGLAWDERRYEMPIRQGGRRQIAMRLLLIVVIVDRTIAEYSPPMIGNQPAWLR
jgi:hypothetical protein